MSESVRSPATATAKGAERAELELRELRRPKGQAGGRAPSADGRIVVQRWPRELAGGDGGGQGAERAELRVNTAPPAQPPAQTSVSRPVALPL